MEQQLTGSHRHTHDTIFRHPATHSLEWRDVRSMLGELGVIVEEPNGSFKVTRHGQSVVFHPHPHGGVVAIDELMEVRHFLERSRRGAAPSAVEGVHLLVVIDHREARVYRTELHGSVPQRIVPYDSDTPHGAGRYLHNMGDDANGQRKPEVASFYEAIAGALKDAEKILVFGGGTGASSAMNHLLSALKVHHKEIAQRVVGSIVIDEHHVSEDQLLAKARELYATLEG